ncbi:septal ring lytic transglycosylase RlpA family protein [Candidatus Nitrospira bockiana]
MALFLSGSLVVSGCAALTKGQTDLDVGMKERGIASWYGDDFHGWVTANGEIYDMYALTGAHRTLPLGTVVRVTNVVNGRRVIIRINDRGPYVHGRILDLSFAAAERLDMLRDGVSAVHLEVVGHQPLGLWPDSEQRPFPDVPYFQATSTGSPPPFATIWPSLGHGHSRPHVIPTDLLRERHARRVGDILAADCRTDVVAELHIA